MDDWRFDQLARMLATRTSRRRVLTASAAATGMVAVGIKASTQPSAAAAQMCRGAQAQCDQDSDCCSGNCDTDQQLCASASEGDPCDPNDETSCNTAGLTCCTDANSGTGGTCTSVATGCPPNGQCGGPNATCMSPDDCCSGLVCDLTSGQCTDVQEGAPCDPSSEGSCQTESLICCANSQSPKGGYCMPADAGCQPSNQCGAPFTACMDDSQCCSGTCSNQQCGGLQPGDPCDGTNPASCYLAGATCCADANSPTGGTCVPIGQCSEVSGQCIGNADKCTSDDACCSGHCSPQGICYCADPDRPLLGCECNPNGPHRCIDLTCCPDDSSSAGGYCRPDCGTPEPSTPIPSGPPTTTPGPSTPSRGATVTALPNTGSGAARHGHHPLLSASLLGAAGAAAAGRKLLRGQAGND